MPLIYISFIVGTVFAIFTIHRQPLADVMANATLPELGVGYESIRKPSGNCFGDNRRFSPYSPGFIWICDIQRDRGICDLAATGLDNCHFG